MSSVVACYKWVIDEEDIRVKSDQTIDVSKARMKISGYDRNAIQAAVTAANAMGARTIGLNYGSPKAKKSAKAALSRGLDELIRIVDDNADSADNVRSASALAAGISSVDDVRLVVMAEGASDDFSRQTAPRVAAALDWPVATCVTALEVADNVARVTRQLEDTTETIEIELPAVVAVLPEICQVPIPSLKQIVAAGKKPSRELEAASTEGIAQPAMHVEHVEAYASKRKNIVFKADDGDAVQKLVAALHKEGVL